MAGPVGCSAAGVLVEVGDRDAGSTTRLHQGSLPAKERMVQGKDFAGLGK